MISTLAVLGALVLSSLGGYWFGQRSKRAYKRKLYKQLYCGKSPLKW